MKRCVTFFNTFRSSTGASRWASDWFIVHDLFCSRSTSNSHGRAKRDTTESFSWLASTNTSALLVNEPFSDLVLFSIKLTHVCGKDNSSFPQYMAHGLSDCFFLNKALATLWHSWECGYLYLYLYTYLVSCLLCGVGSSSHSWECLLVLKMAFLRQRFDRYEGKRTRPNQGSNEVLSPEHDINTTLKDYAIIRDWKGWGRRLLLEALTIGTLRYTSSPAS